MALRIPTITLVSDGLLQDYQCDDANTSWDIATLLVDKQGIDHWQTVIGLKRRLNDLRDIHSAAYTREFAVRELEEAADLYMLHNNMTENVRWNIYCATTNFRAGRADGGNGHVHDSVGMRLSFKAALKRHLIREISRLLQSI